jgi:hypothetical protein
MWPGSHNQGTQNAQLKAAGITGATPSVNTQIKSPNTQGVPKAVSNVNITKMNASDTTAKVSVSFTQNADPVRVSGGAASPVVFTMTRTKAPVTFTVVSQGNWGSTAIDQSPSKSVSLA